MATGSSRLVGDARRPVGRGPGVGRCDVDAATTFPSTRPRQRPRRAAAVALGVVPGRVLGVARDEDDGEWEVTIAQDGREYEVELAPGDLSVLRLDYD